MACLGAKALGRCAMSGATDNLGRTIAGARDLDTVVRSMKALAASGIGQYEKAVEALNVYYHTVKLGLIACLKAGPVPIASNNRAAAVQAIGAIVFGSDQGLVGRFNEVIMEFARRSLASLPVKPARVWAVGERIHELMVDAELPAPVLLAVPNSVQAITPLVGQILIEIEAAARKQNPVHEIYIFHNRPRSGAAYEPVVKRLLPLDLTWQRDLATQPWPTKSLPQIIGAPPRPLEAFVREYLFVLLFQACAESLASENASRLAAMQRAEKNIEQLLEGLNRTFHRLRQESIDEELFEVIAGYESLSQSR